MNKSIFHFVLFFIQDFLKNTQLASPISLVFHYLSPFPSSSLSFVYSSDSTKKHKILFTFISFLYCFFFVLFFSNWTKQIFWLHFFCLFLLILLKYIKRMDKLMASKHRIIQCQKLIISLHSAVSFNPFFFPPTIPVYYDVPNVIFLSIIYEAGFLGSRSAGKIIPLSS